MKNSLRSAYKVNPDPKFNETKDSDSQAYAKNN